MTAAPAPLRLGTRASALARTQSEQVAAGLRARSGRAVELVEVTTRGDVSREPLAQIGGTGVFVSALRDALLAGRVDVAVHSLKDLPTAPVDGVLLVAVPPREDPRDALVASRGRALSDLGPGDRIGTGSPRRAAQLRGLDRDLDVVDVRGNVDTRLSRVADGELDAVVLARAGLLRLGRADEVTEVLDPLLLLPAPGQGALAVECRADDAETVRACATLDDEPSRVCVTAERAVLAALEAGCSAPIGALADWAEGDDGPELLLRAVVCAPDGSDELRRSITGPPEQAEALGHRLAAVLLEDGAATLVPAGSVISAGSDLTGPSEESQPPERQPVPHHGAPQPPSRTAAQESDA